MLWVLILFSSDTLMHVLEKSVRDCELWGSQLSPEREVFETIPWHGGNAEDTRNSGLILGQEDFPEEGIGNPLQYPEEPGGLQSMRSQRVRQLHTHTHTHTHTHVYLRWGKTNGNKFESLSDRCVHSLRKNLVNLITRAFLTHTGTVLIDSCVFKAAMVEPP